MFRTYSGWLAAGALLISMLAVDSIAGPTTPSQYDGCVYTAGGITLTDGQPAVMQCDSTGQLFVHATATLTNPTVGAAVPATANYIAGNKGGLLAGVTIDASGYLQVNCAAGCSGSNPNGQATMANSAPVVIASNQSAIPASESGTWTIQPGNTANTTAWLFTGGVTAADGTAIGTLNSVREFAVPALSNGSSLDIGRAMQNGANTAGTGIAAVGIMGQCLGTPGAVTDTRFANISMNCTDHSLIVSGGLAQEATTAGSLGSLVFGAVTTAAPTYTTAKSDALSLNTSGGLRVDGSGVTQPVSGTVSITANSAVNMAQVSGATTDTNSGTKSAGTLRVVIATDQPALTNKLLVTPDSVALPANQSVNVAQINGVTTTMNNGTAGTGVQRVTIASDSTGQIGPVPLTAGGQTFTTLTLANSTNATNVKASAGQLYTISGFNMSSATPVWVSLYNNSGTPTCGTSIVAQFLIPGNTTGAGFVYNVEPGMAFATGIAFCATTGIAGTGAPAATTYVLNIGYK